MPKILRGINPQLLQSLIFWNCWAILFAIVLYVFLRSQKKISNKIQLPVSMGVFVILVCYIVSVAAITIIPLPYSEQYKRANINLYPFIRTYQNLVDPTKARDRLLATDVVTNILGNVLMFIPFGIFLPELFPKTNRYKYVAVAAFIVSSLIEITQLLSRVIGNYRQADIDDVILNTTGALLGYFIYRNFMMPKNISLVKVKN